MLFRSLSLAHFDTRERSKQSSSHAAETTAAVQRTTAFSSADRFRYRAAFPLRPPLHRDASMGPEKSIGSAPKVFYYFYSPFFSFFTHYKIILNSLHEEILAFCEYISPTVEEVRMREDVISRISQTVNDLWPEVEVFPSFPSFAPLTSSLRLTSSDPVLLIFICRRVTWTYV